MKKMKKKGKAVFYILGMGIVIVYLFSINHIMLIGQNAAKKVSGGEASLQHSPVTAYIDYCYPLNDMYDNVYFQGWAYSDTYEPYQNREMGVVLSDKHGNSYLCTTTAISERPDVYSVCTAQGGILSGILHGYALKFSTLNVPEGKYRVGIYCYENAEAYGIDYKNKIVVKDGNSITIIDGTSDLL